MTNPLLQLKEFVICGFIGVTSGFIYEIINFIATLFKFKKGELSKNKINYNKVIDFIKFIIFFSITAVYFKITAFAFYLATMREYFYLGFILGLFCFYKSFHKAIAIFINLLYTNTSKKNCLQRGR